MLCSYPVGNGKMADKMSDQELANEFKRFGEEIKLPIDRKKRPILIKKLNHYRAKENPPLKRSRSGGRQTKRPVAPPEFSDDSQDETETEPISKLIFAGRKTNAPSVPTYEPERRSLRNRNAESSNSVLRNSRGSRGRTSDVNKRLTEVKQMELYPEEFSDTDDTADESVYEVENKSINTTFNFDSVENETEEDLSPPAKSWSRTAQLPSRRLTNKLSNDSLLSNISNHNSPSSSVKGLKIKSDEPNEIREYTVSSTILTVLAVFFVALALSYAYIRRDLFLPHMAASLQQDLKDSQIELCENEICANYTDSEVKSSLTVINNLHDKLAKLKGKYELGEISEEKIRLKRDTVENAVKKVLEKAADSSRLVELTCHLILKHPEWDIRVFDTDGTEANQLSEVQQFEAVYGDLSLPQRLLLALYKVFYGVLVFCVVVLLCVLGIFCLRWQNKRKEREQKKVYEMVEKIIDILKDNCELAERKNDPKNYPAYMAVQHIRDQLIPVARRKQMQSLWDEAVRFIEANESRIRVETQIIQGEEFTVWRWLQTFPNGGRMWQGQAFGEASPNNANTLPYGPTPCLKVRNMFDSNMEQNTDDWHIDIEDAILEKCKNNNGILHIFVDRTSKEGCVYIKCSTCEKAFSAYQSLHGWWFDGRLVTVKYLRLEHYHDRFPDSRNRKHPLQPSNNDMQSVSRPYHRTSEPRLNTPVIQRQPTRQRKTNATEINKQLYGKNTCLGATYHGSV